MEGTGALPAGRQERLTEVLELHQTLRGRVSEGTNLIKQSFPGVDLDAAIDERRRERDREFRAGLGYAYEDRRRRA